jgi:hypothetical protein
LRRENLVDPGFTLWPDSGEGLDGSKSTLDS